MIVDDNLTNRRILTSLLESWDMKPLAVATGSEALMLVNHENIFDVAILDYQMPEMDGLMIAHTLQNHKHAADLPIVMLSSISDRQAFHNKHIEYWLAKPVKPDQLHQTLASIFGSKLNQSKRTKFNT